MVGASCPTACVGPSRTHARFPLGLSLTRTTLLLGLSLTHPRLPLGLSLTHPRLPLGPQFSLSLHTPARLGRQAGRRL